MRQVKVLLTIMCLCWFGLIQGIEQKKYLNEIGYTQEEDYMSDLKAWWTYMSAYYYHDFDVGKLGARVNHGIKFGGSGNQFQIEAYPKLLEELYLNLTAAWAKKEQIVYPSFQYMIEAFYNIENMEFSLGQGGWYFSMFSNQDFFDYTGSIGTYFDNYFVWARFNVYTFSDCKFFLIGARRYFNEKDQNIALILNAGTMPDIGDLPPLDQMVKMQQLGISLMGSILIVKALYLNWAVGYAHQLYPNHHIRNDTSTVLGLKWKF